MSLLEPKEEYVEIIDKIYSNELIEYKKIKNVLYEDCSFTNCRFTHVKFENCSFINCYFDSNFFKLCEINDCNLNDFIIKSNVFVFTSFIKVTLRSGWTAEENNNNTIEENTFNRCTFVDIYPHTEESYNSSLKTVRFNLILNDDKLPENNFIAYKSGRDNKGNICLIKLEIPKDAIKIIPISDRNSHFYRCDKAKVLDIIDENKESLEECTSLFRDFKYIKGEMAYADKINTERIITNGHGIHFFLNKREALTYGNHFFPVKRRKNGEIKYD